MAGTSGNVACPRHTATPCPACCVRVFQWVSKLARAALLVNWYWMARTWTPELCAHHAFSLRLCSCQASTHTSTHPQGRPGSLPGSVSEEAGAQHCSCPANLAPAQGKCQAQHFCGQQVAHSVIVKAPIASQTNCERISGKGRRAESDFLGDVRPQQLPRSSSPGSRPSTVPICIRLLCFLNFPTSPHHQHAAALLLLTPPPPSVERNLLAKGHQAAWILCIESKARAGLPSSACKATSTSGCALPYLHALVQPAAPLPRARCSCRQGPLAGPY